MKLSFLVPTHNRQHSLARALNSLVAMTKPSDCALEVIVVASGCSDDTVGMALQFSDRLPLRVIIEPQPGVARARNRGLDEIDGDGVIFLDDDAAVRADLACVYSAAFAEYPTYGCFCGAIITQLEGDPPAVIRDVARILPTTYSQLWLGPSLRPLETGAYESPFSANMAIRISALDGRRFDERLGRQGHGGLEAGEETHLFEQMNSAGVKSLWLPDAHVDHWIESGRQKLGYVRRYWYQIGVMQIRLGHVTPEKVRLALAHRFRLEQTFWLRRFISRPEKWLPALRELMLHKGHCAGVRQLSKWKQYGEDR